MTRHKGRGAKSPVTRIAVTRIAVTRPPTLIVSPAPRTAAQAVADQIGVALADDPGLPPLADIEPGP
jgi:hypothetical protein